MTCNKNMWPCVEEEQVSEAWVWTVQRVVVWVLLGGGGGEEVVLGAGC